MSRIEVTPTQVYVFGTQLWVDTGYTIESLELVSFETENVNSQYSSSITDMNIPYSWTQETETATPSSSIFRRFNNQEISQILARLCPNLGIFQYGHYRTIYTSTSFFSGYHINLPSINIKSITFNAYGRYLQPNTSSVLYTFTCNLSTLPGYSIPTTLPRTVTPLTYNSAQLRSPPSDIARIYIKDITRNLPKVLHTDWSIATNGALVLSNLTETTEYSVEILAQNSPIIPCQTFTTPPAFSVSHTSSTINSITYTTTIENLESLTVTVKNYTVTKAGNTFTVSSGSSPILPNSTYNTLYCTIQGYSPRTLPAAKTLPNPPSITVQETLSTTVTLGIRAPSQPADYTYTIGVFDPYESLVTTIENIPWTTSTYTITGLSADQTYTINVYSVNSVGQSPTHASVSATTKERTAAPTPTEAYARQNEVVFKWTPPTLTDSRTITGYKVHTYANSSTTAFRVDTVATPTFSFIGTPGTTYTFKVQTLTDIDEGFLSNFMWLSALCGTISLVSTNTTTAILAVKTGGAYYNLADRMLQLRDVSTGQIIYNNITGYGQITGDIYIGANANTIYATNNSNGMRLTIYSMPSGAIFRPRLIFAERYILEGDPIGLASAPEEPTFLGWKTSPLNGNTTLQLVLETEPNRTGFLPLDTYTVSLFNVDTSANDFTTTVAVAGEAPLRTYYEPLLDRIVVDASVIVPASNIVPGAKYQVRASCSNGALSSSMLITPGYEVGFTFASVPKKPTILQTYAADGSAVVNVAQPSYEEAGLLLPTGIRFKVYDENSNELPQFGVTYPLHTVLNDGNAIIYNNWGSPYEFNNILTNGETYSFKVAIRNAGGWGEDSEMSAPVVPTGPAAAPADLTITDVSSTPGAVLLEWPAVTNWGGQPIDASSNKYRIDYYLQGEPETHLGDIVLDDVTVTSQIISDLSADVTYIFRIGSLNALRPESYFDIYTERSHKIGSTIQTEPAPVTNLRTVVSASALTILWEPPKNNGRSQITGYDVQVLDAEENIVASIENTQSLSYSTSALSVGSYIVRVTANNAIGSSTPAEDTPAVITPPGAPTIVAVENRTEDATNGKLFVSWSPPANDGGSPITAYNVTVYIRDGGPDYNYGSIYFKNVRISLTDAPDVSSCIVDYLPIIESAPFYYFVKVQAQNDAGWGGESDESPLVLVEPERTPAPAVASLTVEPNETARSLTAKWEPPSGSFYPSYIAGYTVQLVNMDTSSNIQTYNTDDRIITSGRRAFEFNTTSYTFTDVSLGVGYAVRVAAKNGEIPLNWTTSDTYRLYQDPSAATILSATLADGTVAVTFIPPTFTGGAAIESYTLAVFDDTIDTENAIATQTVALADLSDGDISGSKRIIYHDADGSVLRTYVDYRIVLVVTTTVPRTASVEHTSLLRMAGVPAAPDLVDGWITNTPALHLEGSYDDMNYINTAGITAAEISLYDVSESLLATYSGVVDASMGVVYYDVSSYSVDVLYKVKARVQNSAGWSAWSAFSDIIVPFSAPDKVGTISTAYTNGETSVRLSFEKPTTTNGRPILYYQTMIIESNPVTETITSTTTMEFLHTYDASGNDTNQTGVVSGLVAGMEYLFMVRAFNGLYGQYRTALGTTTITEPAAAASNTLAVSSSTTSDLVITWARVTGASIYLIRYGLSGEPAYFFDIADLDASDNMITITATQVTKRMTGLTAGTTYVFTVTYLDANLVESKSSQTITATSGASLASVIQDVVTETPSLLKSALRAAKKGGFESTPITLTSINTATIVDSIAPNTTLPTTVVAVPAAPGQTTEVDLPAVSTDAIVYIPGNPGDTLTISSNSSTYTLEFPTSGSAVVIVNGTPYYLGDTVTLDGVNFKVAAQGSVGLIRQTETPPPPVPCFLADAPVLTPRGYRPIASLAAGDLVMTADGRAVPVERVSVTRVSAPSAAVNPYVIKAGQFGARERLLISPNHRVAVPGRGLVEARHLGLTQWTMRGAFDYYNLELPCWKTDNMVVAGVEVESLAPVRRVVVTTEEFKRMVAEKYGASLSADMIRRIVSCCRTVGTGHVEVPMMKKNA